MRFHEYVARPWTERERERGEGRRKSRYAEVTRRSSAGVKAALRYYLRGNLQSEKNYVG